MFISAYSKERRNTNCTPAGSEIEPVYGYEVDKKGMKVLKENGKKNVYDQIQEYLEETLIENVIQRVVAGDTSMLRPNAIYDDVSEMPNNLLDAMNQIKALENAYESSPEEIKKLYPTLEAYVENAGSEAWLKANGYIQEIEPLETPATEIKDQIKEVTPNES